MVGNGVPDLEWQVGGKHSRRGLPPDSPSQGNHRPSWVALALCPLANSAFPTSELEAALYVDVCSEETTGREDVRIERGLWLPAAENEADSGIDTLGPLEAQLSMPATIRS